MDHDVFFRRLIEVEHNMADGELLKRITANQEIFGGKPIIHGMRISVELTPEFVGPGSND